MSDLHLWLTPPAARAQEKDWPATQQGYLEQLVKISRPLERPVAAGDLPIICAGDVFHRYNAPAELINWALKHLPMMYCVPGQHDLPNHRYEDVHKSAYWTLVEAKKIINLDPKCSVSVGDLRLHGFPWGTPLSPFQGVKSSLLWDIAVIHRYIWTPDTGYPGAPPENRLKNTRKLLRGFDVAVFGDNHVPFLACGKEPLIVNNGGFVRRNRDEREHRPRVHLLMSDKTIEPRYLDTSKDLFADPEDVIRGVKVMGKPVSEILETLKGVAPHAIPFDEAVRRWLDKNKVEKGVADLILATVQECGA